MTEDHDDDLTTQLLTLVRSLGDESLHLLLQLVRSVQDERAELARAVDLGAAEAAGIRALDARWEADE